MAAATVVELRTAVATLKRANESMKRRHREQARILDNLSSRVSLLEYGSDETLEFGDAFSRSVARPVADRVRVEYTDGGAGESFSSRAYRDAFQLPKTESDVTPPRVATSGAARDSSRRSFFDWIFGRRAK